MLIMESVESISSAGNRVKLTTSLSLKVKNTSGANTAGPEFLESCCHPEAVRHPARPSRVTATRNSCTRDKPQPVIVTLCVCVWFLVNCRSLDVLLLDGTKLAASLRLRALF